MSSPLRADIFEQGIRRARLGVWDWDLIKDECQYSNSWFAMLGYSQGELQVSSDLWLELTHPDDRARALESGERHIRGEAEEIETELRLKHKSGHWLWVLDRGGVVERDVHGRATRVVGVQVDISRQKAVEQQLQMVNERFRTAMEATDLGLWEYDIETKRSLWDGPTRAIFGLNPEGAEQPGAFWNCFLHPEDRERTELAHGAIGAETRAIRYRIIRLDGQVRHVETFAHLVPNPDGTARLVGSIRDVTDDVRGREALAWAASHDALTGLLTRAAFEERLQCRLAATDGQPMSLLYIDLDHFKQVNDTRGHAAGDLVLREVARTLLLKAKFCDVARLGGTNSLSLDH